MNVLVFEPLTVEKKRVDLSAPLACLLERS